MGIDHSENWGCQGLLVVNHSTVQATIPHSGPLIRYPHQLQLQFVNVIMFLLFIYFLIVIHLSDSHSIDRHIQVTLHSIQVVQFNQHSILFSEAFQK